MKIRWAKAKKIRRGRSRSPPPTQAPNPSSTRSLAPCY